MAIKTLKLNALNNTLQIFNYSTSRFLIDDDFKLCDMCLSNSSNNSEISSPNMLRIAYYTIGTIGLVFNGFVAFILTFMNRNGPNNTSSFHIKLQSCVDSLVAISLLVTTAKEGDGHTKYNPDSFSDEFTCRFWYTKIPLWSSLLASTYSVIALNLDRYIAVIYPIFHKVKFSKKRMYSIILGASCIAVGPVFNVNYSIFSSGIQQNHECLVYNVFPNETLRSFGGFLTLIVQFFLPLIVIIVLYLKMIITLQSKVAPREEITEPSYEDGQTVFVVEAGQPGSSSDIKQKKGKKSFLSKTRANNKILKTAGLLSLSFITCWSFNQIYFLMYQLNIGNLALSGTFYHFTVLMVFANCCFNPVVYSINFEPFQNNSKYLLKKVKDVFVSK